MPRSTFSQQYEEAMSRFQRPGAQTAAQTEPAPAPTYVQPTFFKEIEEEVPDTWKPFSEVFGFAPPSGNDRKGPVYEVSEFPDQLRGFIPAKSIGYFMPPEDTEALWNAHIDGDVVWLWGQSGTGKSSLEQQFAAYINQPFLRFNGREDIESGALFGQLTVESGDGGGTVWEDGLVTEGVRYGARILMDEATVIPAGIMMSLQWLLERDGKLMLTDKPDEAGERLIEPDPRFRLTFADNTRGQGDDTGQFNSTGIMNTATLNRVGLTREIKYLTPDQELTVLKNKFGDRYEDTLLTATIELGGLLRRAMSNGQISLAFSLRSMESMLNKAYHYRTQGLVGVKRAFADAYTNLLPSDEEQGAALNFFDMVFDAL